MEDDIILCIKIFLLAGQSIKNKEWIEKVEGEFRKEFQDTTVLYYDHWDSNSNNIDIEKESSKLVKMINEYKGEYLIFAKSIGTIVFYNIVEKLKRKPKGVLMVGVPYDLASEMGFDMGKLKDNVEFDINIYQKKFDPFGNLEKIKSVEGGKVKVYEYVCTDEDDDNHHYSNSSYLLKLIKTLF